MDDEVKAMVSTNVEAYTAAGYTTNNSALLPSGEAITFLERCGATRGRVVVFAHGMTASAVIYP